MKHLLIISIALLFSLVASAQSKEKNPPFNIKQYYFVMLTKGANRTQDSTEAAKIQAGHMANITKLAEAKKLVVAGPFGDDGNWRGIFIFDCKDQKEVEELLKTDPAISSGRLAYEIHPWFTQPGTCFK